MSKWKSLTEVDYLQNPPRHWCLLSFGDHNRAVLAKWSRSHYTWIGIDLLPIMGSIETGYPSMMLFNETGEIESVDYWKNTEIEYLELPYSTLQNLLGY